MFRCMHNYACCDCLYQIKIPNSIFLKVMFEFNCEVIPKTLVLLRTVVHACQKSEACVSQGEHNMSCIEIPYLQRGKILISQSPRNSLDLFLSKIYSWNLSFLHIFHSPPPENHLVLPIKYRSGSLLKSQSGKFDNPSFILRKSHFFLTLIIIWPKNLKTPPPLNLSSIKLCFFPVMLPKYWAVPWLQ